MNRSTPNPLFSVIVPTYNRLDFLKKNLDSIWSQSFTDFEVIVVDDGSSDGTLEYLKSCGRGLTAISQKNSGPGAARNRGVEVARGEYLAFLDSDDLWFPWTLETYAKVIGEQKSLCFVAGSSINFSDPATVDRVEQGEFDQTVESDFLNASYTQKRNIVHSCSAFVLKRSLFHQVAGFTNRPINAEDTDLLLKCSTAGEMVHVLSPLSFAYRDHDGNAVNDFTKTYQGLCFVIEQEKSGKYPGGRARRVERLAFICRHLRPASLSLIRSGDKAAAWQLYRSSFSWHLRLLRFRYLIGFFLKMLR